MHINLSWCEDSGYNNQIDAKEMIQESLFMTEKADVIIVGAGASGLMCAARAGKRGRQVLVLDNGPKPGRKILMAGGGKCNFTNCHVTAENYICANPHFVKSALSRYSSDDFIAMVDTYGIRFHERSHGQLFCDKSAADILEMLLDQCRQARVCIEMNSQVSEILQDKASGKFHVRTGRRRIETAALVIATGGVSIPGAGATPFGYQVAERFNISVIPPRPGLVPFTLAPKDKALCQSLAGISVTARARCSKAVFQEELLFTHRGLSGPVILQVSSYWHPGETITIDLLPRHDTTDLLDQARKSQPRKQALTLIRDLLPKRLADLRLKGVGDIRQPVANLTARSVEQISTALHRWQIKPGGTEGNRTAEVTVGGVDCHAISSKTFEARNVPGLYFIGEVLDVTGQLGGYNLQWAWSSGFCAGQAV